MKIRKSTNSNIILTLAAITGLSLGAILIFYYEFTTEWEQMIFILSIYLVLTLSAIIFAKKNTHRAQ